MIIRTHKNKLKAYGGIWTGTAYSFISALSMLEREYSDIDVHIHTYGGDVFEGNLMYNALNSSQANITLIIDGVAASMGGLLALSRPKVKMVENGFLMYHAPHSYVSGTAQDFEKNAKLLRMVESNFKDKLKNRTGKSDKEIDKLMSGDNWFDAKEAKNMGFISEIIPAKTEAIIPIEKPSELGEKDVFNIYASLMTSINNGSINNNHGKMKERLITLFALAIATTASETEVVDALVEKFNAMKTAKEKAENDLQAFTESNINALVESVNIDPEQKEVYKSIGIKSGIEALRTVIAGMSKTAAPNLTNQIIGGGSDIPENRSGWDFDKWQEEDPKGLEAMADKEPDKFKKLLNEKYK